MSVFFSFEFILVDASEGLNNFFVRYHPIGILNPPQILTGIQFKVNSLAGVFYLIAFRVNKFKDENLGSYYKNS